MSASHPVPPSPPSRSRSRVLPLLVGLVICTAAFVASPSPPAGAWTVDQSIPGKVLFISKRMNANTVHATVTMALFENGNYEYRVDVHNGARIAKTYRASGQVYIPGMGLVAQYETGERDIEGKRNDDYDTIYQRGYDPRIAQRFANAMDIPPEAKFNLSAGWKNGGAGAESWCPATSNFYTCDAPTRPPQMD